MPSLVCSIIANHAMQELVSPGQTLLVNVDKVYIQDGNSPTINKLFKKYGFKKVFDPEKISVFFDHSVLPPNIDIANRLKEAEDFCSAYDLKMYKNGEGISHIVALEEGIYEPGSIVLGSDSHTCTGGVYQCLALGMGATDIAAAMVSGKTWLHVPKSVCVNVIGKPSKHTTSKDVMLYLMSIYDHIPFLYNSIEWKGEWLKELTLDSAATIANMTVELGGKNCFLPPRKNEEISLREINTPQEDYFKIINLDITNLPPYIALPHSPSNAVPLENCKEQKIDMIFVGSCTNSRLEDIKIVSSIIDGQKIDTKVQLIVTPGSRKVYLDALRLGYLEKIIMAGGIVTPPGCGSCLGTQGPIPADNMNILSTMNRNFLGRMGNAKANIFLSSPRVAAYAALLGKIPCIEDLVV